MKRDLATGTWKLLRALVREPELTGKQLRWYDYGRRTKDGTFLDALVADGLIEPTGRVVDDDTPAGHTPKPAQFRTVYRLTEKGRGAAEYGEYQVPDPVRIGERQK